MTQPVQLTTTRVLLALDRTAGAECALQRVLARPWPDGAQLRLLHVITQDLAEAPRGVATPSAPLGEVPPWPEGTLRTVPMIEADARALLDSAAQRCQSLGLAVETTLRVGEAGREIVQVAEDWRADLIIVGATRHSVWRRLLLGSVAEHVMRHAPCSVEVVRAKG